MLDVSSAQLERVIVHKVGNKIREEGYVLSESELDSDETLNEVLIRGYLKPLSKSQKLYDFFHESDISLNAVNNFSKKIFLDQSTFVEESKHVAKHLYSVSTHPNVSEGELIIMLVSNIFLDEEPGIGLAILKVESKDEYLDIREQDGVITVYERQGVPLGRVQKGALVLSQDGSVLSVDNLGHKTKYWDELFLKLMPKKNDEFFAGAAAKVLKGVVSKCQDSETILEINKKLEDSLEESGKVSFEKIREISEEIVGTEASHQICESALGGRLSEDTSAHFVDGGLLKKKSKSFLSRVRIVDGAAEVVMKSDKFLLKDVLVSETEKEIKAILRFKKNEVNDG
ncbi:nucleoid-associated protein [Marinobacter sp. KM021]|uniref:nucleoid-associated protein n=1 Tax=Marinobacter sp. KM021 TaxID=3075616 RepID=UPI003D6BF84A